MKLSPVLLIVMISCQVFLAAGNEPAATSPAILDKLEQIVALRQRALDVATVAAQEARNVNIYEYEIALCEARIELAKARSQQDVVVDQLKKILTHQEVAHKMANLKYELGKADVDVVLNWKIRMLETEVAIEKAVPAR